MDQLAPLADRARSLARELRESFDDVEVRLGELFVGGVEGELDPLGGAIATLDDSGSEWRVQLMPALGDRGVLLAACECTSAGEAPCAHLWAVLRVIDARDLWPRDVAIPTDVEVTDPDDPDLELIAEGAGVAIRGIARVPVLATGSRARADSVARDRRVRRWCRRALPRAGA